LFKRLENKGRKERRKKLNFFLKDYFRACILYLLNLRFALNFALPSLDDRELFLEILRSADLKLEIGIIEIEC